MGASSEMLKAGRELDAEVATRIMGYRWAGNPRGNRWIMNADDDRVAMKERGKPLHVFGMHGDWLPSYSTDIADAWTVVEKMRSLKPRYDFWQLDSLGFDGEEWRCGFSADFAPDDRRFYIEQADTAPLAICRAALSAIPSTGEHSSDG